MKKSLTNKIIGLVLSFMILFGCIPMQVFALPGDGNQPGLTSNGQYNIDGRTILLYVTSNGGDISRTGGSNSDTSQQFTATANDNWIFHKWLTYYEGPTVKDDNHVFTFSDDYYFSQPGNKENAYTSTNNVIQINKEWDAKGTYYLYAIFKPKVTIETDMMNTVSFRPANDFVSGIGRVEGYVSYGNVTDIQIYMENDRVVKNVKINNSDLDSNEYQISNGWLELNDIYVTRPTNVNVITRKKIQKVSFDANGGTGTMEQQTFNSGEEKPLTANSFTRYKYEFIGWNTKADGTGTNYAHNGNVVFNPTNDGENITLYAQWERLPNANYTAPTANDLTYNTQEQELITKGISNDGVFKYSLEENGVFDETVPTAKNAGTYTVWYYVEGDNNHNDSNKTSVEVEIKKANPDIGTVSANDIIDTTDISALVLKRTNENVEGELIFDENQSLNLGENIINYEFIPDDTSNYNVIDGQVSVTVKDTVSPTGTVKFADIETVWDEIPGTITFDMYFKNNQKIIVTATDSFSGVDKIEYYETDEILDLEGLKLITEEEWNLVEGDVNIPVEDGKQFIYYIRITDKSANIGYIATNGAEFDTTAPTISGVYDGKTYYTSQKVTVTDKNLDTVTLNGEIVTDTIILEGNKEATYTIVATDKVGNSTTVTVKMAVSDDINENTNKLNNPTTGDNIGKYFAMFGISIIGLIAVAFIKKKNNK